MIKSSHKPVFNFIDTQSPINGFIGYKSSRAGRCLQARSRHADTAFRLRKLGSVD